MKYYKNKYNKPFAYEDNINEDLLSKFIENHSLTSITKDEFKALTSPTLDQTRTSKLNEINQDCNKAIVSGFKSSALGLEYFYYSTTEEQLNLSSLTTIGIGYDFKCQKVLLDDEENEYLDERKKHFHTFEQLKKVLADGAVYIYSAIEKKDLLEAQIESATTIEELEAISWEEAV